MLLSRGQPDLPNAAEQLLTYIPDAEAASLLCPSSLVPFSLFQSLENCFK